VLTLLSISFSQTFLGRLGLEVGTGVGLDGRVRPQYEGWGLVSKGAYTLGFGDDLARDDVMLKLT